MKDHIKRLKGAKDLVFDAVEETTNLVERMHSLAAKKSTQPLALIEPLATLTRGVKTVHDSIASGVYEMIRIVNQGVKKMLDAGTGPVADGLLCPPDTLLQKSKEASINALDNTCEPSGGVSGLLSPRQSSTGYMAIIWIKKRMRLTWACISDTREKLS